MIKQKYDYKFFVDNYSYRYDSMFRKYYKMLESKYRYFIIVTKDCNKHQSEVFRSNSSIEDILLELKDIEFQMAKVIDNYSKFPEVYSYHYNKHFGLQWITETYRLRSSSLSLRNRSADKWYYKYWNDKRYIWSCLVDDDTCQICFKGIYISNYKGKIKVGKPVPFSESIELKFDTDTVDKLKRVVKRIQKDNINGFYDDMIERIKNDFGIKYI